MKKLTEGFIKSAARAGDAVRDRDVNELRYCPKTVEWAELPKAPSTEQLIRHMTDCEICMGLAACALISWTAQLKAGAVRRAIAEQVRRHSAEN